MRLVSQLFIGDFRSHVAPIYKSTLCLSDTAPLPCVVVLFACVALSLGEFGCLTKLHVLLSMGHMSIYHTCHVIMSVMRHGRRLDTWCALGLPHHQAKYFPKIFERPYFSHTSSVFVVHYIHGILSMSSTAFL